VLSGNFDLLFYFSVFSSLTATAFIVGFFLPVGRQAGARIDFPSSIYAGLGAGRPI
jgi:hypothetical protein